jgi:hypothetical protein
MEYMLERLKPKERRGSKPRCHFLTHGCKEEVARRLTSLVDPHGVVSASDVWIPAGFEEIEEAQLDRADHLIRSKEDRDALRNWWLAEPKPTSRTPTWDIVSTCAIGGRPGILLVEAKAHSAELMNEEAGKRFGKSNSKANHVRIGQAIEEANAGLRRATTDRDWRLSSGRCYQMSNRFAWAWRLCTLGYPVALVYLGFLDADMPSPFRSDSEWCDLVKRHSASLFPADIWGQVMAIGRIPFVPMIAVRHQHLL